MTVGWSSNVLHYTLFGNIMHNIKHYSPMIGFSLLTIVHTQQVFFPSHLDHRSNELLSFLCFCHFFNYLLFKIFSETTRQNFFLFILEDKKYCFYTLPQELVRYYVIPFKDLCVSPSSNKLII